jgi:hypothetical protein
MTFSFRDRVGGSSYLVFGVAKLCSSPRAQCPVYALGEGGLSGLGVRCVWGTVYIYTDRGPPCWLTIGEERFTAFHNEARHSVASRRTTQQGQLAQQDVKVMR